jgi:phosphoribosylaminoimidazole-succinocarboxamide synthase
VNNLVTASLYTYFEKNKIPTHFVESLGEREMLVKKVDIIPIEVVIRNKAAGSLCKRLGIKKGKVLNPCLLEYFLKSDELGDPLLSEGHILYFGWAKGEQLAQMVEYSQKINLLLVPLFLEAGFELIDFKLEFGTIGTEKKLVLADEFSPDGCRLWDIKTGESFDKDRFREDLGKVEESYQEVYSRLSKLNRLKGTL